MRKIFDDSKVIVWLGPLLISLTLSLAHKGSYSHYDVWLLLCGALYLFWKMPKRALWFVLGLFALSSCKFFFLPFSFWELGLQVSFAASLFLTYFSFQETDALLGNIANQKEIITFLSNKTLAAESAVQAEKETAQQALTQAEEKANHLAQQIASLQNLADTLRHANESDSIEKNALIDESVQKNKAFKQLKMRFDILQEELARLQDAAKLQRTNQELLHNLNAARVEKYQTHLINETLARLLAKEAKKVKEALDSCHVKELEQGALQQNLEHAQQEAKDLCLRFEGASKELDELRSKLDEKQEEIQNLQQTPKSPETNQIEATYLQLRKQFEEKNENLHQTRVQLFQVETQLDALLREKQSAHFEEDPLFSEAVYQIDHLEEELVRLEKEQMELLALITHLIGEGKKSPKKKISVIENQLPIF